MDIDVGAILVLSVIIVIVGVIVDVGIVQLFPKSRAAKRIVNKQVINEAMNKVRETHQPVSLHVDIDGNVTVDEE